MSNLEEVRNELIELENVVALLSKEIEDYTSSTKDGIERRQKLSIMYKDLYEKKTRLNYLRKLV